MDEGSSLLRLQQVDLELARCERELTQLPQRDKVAQIRTALKGLSRDITHIGALRKDVEMEMSDNRDARAETELQVDEAQAGAMADAADYRAVKDLDLRLTDLAKRLEKLDFDHSGLEAQLEELLAKEHEATVLKGRLEQQERLQVDSFKSAAHDILVRRKELAEERRELASGLPSALVARYDQACERFGGQGVERLVGNRPTACRVTLQPSSYSSLKNMVGITECPYCRRILVLAEGDE